MKKLCGAILLAAILVVCMGMRGIIPVDVSINNDSEKVTMYAEDGRTEQFEQSEAEAQKNVGWYDNINDVISTMWNDEGKSVVVFKADIEKYRKKGYTTNHSAIFSKVTNTSTGEERDVLKADVQEYLSNGWKRGKGNVDPDQPMVCLTFDDGPSDNYTMKLLEALEKNDARATFYMLGKSVESSKKAEELISKMKEIGCEISSHTWDHTQLTTLGSNAIDKQITDTQEAIKKYSGEDPVTLRPPYGSINDDVKKFADAPIILWSMDTLDWKYLNADTVYQNTLDDIQDGDIILLHDIHKTSVEAAIKLIPALQNKGYQLVTVSEMAEAKGIDMENGKSYTDFRPSTVRKLNSSSDDSSKSSSSSDKKSSSNSDDGNDNDDKDSNKDSNKDNSKKSGSSSSSKSSSDSSKSSKSSD